MTQTTRLSRFSREPVRSNEKAVVVRRPSEGDFEKLKVLARRRFLTCDWIARCVGANADFVVSRFNILKRNPNNYVKIADEIRGAQRAFLFMPLFYELDAKGIAYLDERGVAIPKRHTVRNFEHQCMTDQIMASFEIGASETPGIELILWSTIIASEKTPNVTREASAPHILPIQYQHNGKMYERKVCADGYPFGIRRTIGGKQSYIFLSGPETDCATEPIETGDFDRSSIQGKFLAYLAIIEQRTFNSHFGVPNFFVPFFTTNRRRMESMMLMLDRLTNGEGSRNILFATHPSIYAFERATPSGNALTRAYRRVGYPDFFLNK